MAFIEDLLNGNNTANNIEDVNANIYMKFNNDTLELQNLNEIQSAEYISLFGVDVEFIKLDINNIDINFVLGELKKKVYKDVFKIRMLMENNNSFDGSGDFFNLGGVTIDDEVTFLIDINTIERVLGRRPIIGDLIIHTPSTKIFKIIFVDDEVDNSFYSGGKNYLYKLKSKQYKYSGEKTEFRTENDNINAINETETLTDIESDMNEFYNDDNNPFKR